MRVTPLWVRISRHLLALLVVAAMATQYLCLWIAVGMVVAALLVAWVGNLRLRQVSAPQRGRTHFG